MSKKCHDWLNEDDITFLKPHLRERERERERGESAVYYTSPQSFIKNVYLLVLKNFDWLSWVLKHFNQYFYLQKG